MVRKIKKRIKAGPDTVFAVPLALTVTALAGPRREGRDVRRPFSPAWQMRDLFLDHFDLDVVTTDRPLSLDEYAAWPGAADPRWALQSSGDHGAVLTKAPESLDDATIRLGIVPVIARVSGGALDALGSLWGTEFPEVARTSLTGLLNEAFGLIPGYDRAVFAGPRPARDLNALIAHLSALVADECALGGVAQPMAFPLCHERLLAAIPMTARI